MYYLSCGTWYLLLLCGLATTTHISQRLSRSGEWRGWADLGSGGDGPPLLSSRKLHPWTDIVGHYLKKMLKKTVTTQGPIYKLIYRSLHHLNSVTKLDWITPTNYIISFSPANKERRKTGNW